MLPRTSVVLVLTLLLVRFLQAMHPAWENFDISKLHEEYAKLEAEKQAYLAAKAAAGGH